MKLAGRTEDDAKSNRTGDEIMPIEVRVDVEPVSIILNDGSGWQWLPNETDPSLLEVRDKQSNVVAVFPKDRVVYVRVINDLSQQQELSSNLEKDHPKRWQVYRLQIGCSEAASCLQGRQSMALQEKDD